MKVARKGDTFIGFADGSCLKNPGRGAWAVVVYVDGKAIEFVGTDPATTNNRMELTAATRALEALPADAVGVLRLDSNYVVQGLAEWRYAWVKNGWRNAKNKPVLNADLWQALIAVRDLRPKVRIEWGQRSRW